jgi:hypothetical protein
MKQTPASAIAKRQREDKLAEATSRENLNEICAVDQARYTERRRKEEEIIKRDLGRTKTARQIDEFLQLHYQGLLDRSKKAMACTE